MDADQVSKLLALEKALWDQTMEPTDLPLSLLRDITKNFSPGQEIGRGGFGAVYKGELRNGAVAVKKLYDLAAVREENFRSEVDLLVSVRHKNTVRLLGYCSDTQHILDNFNGKHVWGEVLRRLLCFEFLRNGSLADYITDPSSGLHWSTRYEIIRGICEGVHYLHQHRIIHMDLKPLNILLDDNMMPKITDFGLSRRFSENQSRDITKNIAGSWGYMAPEFLTSKKITLKTDIFSLGVIIMEMLMGCKGSPNVTEILESWRNKLGTVESHIPLEQVKVCAEIAILCMDDDPEKRPTSWDIILRIFDEEEISNWSARGEESTSSISKVSSFVDKLEDELKSMNLYGHPLLSERVIALKRAGETNNEIISYSGLLDVHPQELRFPFEARKPISCALSLTNKTDQFVLWMILPELPDMFVCEKNIHGTLMRNSTCCVTITMVEQQERPLKTNTLYVLMITSESADSLSDLLLFITSDNKDVVDLPKRIEELGGHMHLAMVMALVCPLSEIITPMKIFRKELVLYDDTLDVHPTEPWILIAENRLRVSILNYETKAVVMSFESTVNQGWINKMLNDDLEIYAAKFIPRKQWFVTGDHIGNIHVYSYVARKKMKKFSAYFSCSVDSLAVHPTYTLLISLTEDSDTDHPIRIWDWDMGWKCVQRITRGNIACVPGPRFKFNPKDKTTFAGGFRTCHVWSIHSSEPTITISPPDTSADSICDSICDYIYTDSNGKYLITPAKDGGLRVFDLVTVSCVHTLLQDKFIDCVACHPTLPLIVSGARDDAFHQIFCFWNAANYRLLKMVRYMHDDSIKEFAFVGSRRLVIRYTGAIEVMEIDLEALAYQQ